MINIDLNNIKKWGDTWLVNLNPNKTFAYLKPFSTIVYLSVLWKMEYMEKTVVLLQIKDKFYYINLHLIHHVTCRNQAENVSSHKSFISGKQLSKHWNILWNGFLIIFSDRCDLENPGMVEQIQWKLINYLRCLLKKSYDNPDQRLWQIFDSMTSLRNLEAVAKNVNELFSKSHLSEKIIKNPFHNMFQCLLNCFPLIKLLHI
jgi:hypothetical protein